MSLNMPTDETTLIDQCWQDTAIVLADTGRPDEERMRAMLMFVATVTVLDRPMAAFDKMFTWSKEWMAARVAAGDTSEVVRLQGLMGELLPWCAKMEEKLG